MKNLLLISVLLSASGCSVFDPIPTFNPDGTQQTKAESKAYWKKVSEFPTFIHEDGTPWTALEIQAYANALNAAYLPVVVCSRYSCVSI
tara:strand:+ start:386 stop:652 length:267 start_codon:yes stop_codon:yes gene_type:complete